MKLSFSLLLSPSCLIRKWPSKLLPWTQKRKLLIEDGRVTSSPWTVGWEMKFSFTETSGFWASLLYQLCYNLTKRPVCALRYSGWHLPTKPRSTPWRLDRAAWEKSSRSCGLFKLWVLGKLRNGIHCSSWENTPSTNLPLNVSSLLLIV